MQRILILGASSLVGSAIINELKDGYDLYGTYFSSGTGLNKDREFQLEIQQINQLKKIIHSINPDLVISCLRGNFDHQLNFHEELAKELRNNNTRVYFFSTTNVFDGDPLKPHTETDNPNAESDYGKYKIKCENILKEILGERAVIIRIPAIWGKDAPRWNIIKESIKNNYAINVYSNLICNNLLDVQLAKQVLFIIDNKLKGIFHLGSVDMATQGQFYEQLVSRITNENHILRYHLYEDKADTFYFYLKSNRHEIPASLQSTNDDIVSYLLE